MALPESVAAIFPFAPNWSAAPEYRREYLTDVLYSRDRTPQRRALRAKPREMLSYTLTAAGREALAVQQFLSVLQPYPLLVPLWPRVCRLAGEASDTTLPLDRPFPADMREGDAVVLMREGEEPEAASIEAFSSDRKTLTLDTALAATWPSGSAVYPAWVARLSGGLSARRLTASVMEASVQVEREVDRRPPATPYGSPELEVGGLEVLLKRINWRDAVRTPFDWVAQLVDAEVGPRAAEITGRYSPLSLSADVLCRSREEADWWLGFLDRHKGRRGQFLAPAHVDPLPLQAATGSAAFEVRGADLGHYAPHEDVVTHLLVRKPGGGIGLYAIDTITPDFEDDVTRITTLDAWDEDYGPEAASSTWLVWQARLGSDAFELRWHTAEVAEFTLAITATERLPA